MAKIKVYDALEGMYLGDAFAEGTIEVAKQTATQFVVEDENGAQIIFAGTKFKYEDGVPQKGTITSVTFTNSDGEPLVKYTDDSWPLTSDFVPANLQNIFVIASFFNKCDDSITGSSQGDDLFAGSNPGNDVIKGLDGDDYITADAGNNSYEGGDGFDQLTYERATAGGEGVVRGLELDADEGKALNPWGGKDTFSSMEAYRGSMLADTMNGAKTDELFMGLEGNDRIDGAKGFDTARYDRDDSYGGTQGIVANLSTGKVIDTFGDTDRLEGIEAIQGSSFDDVFVGNDAANLFTGGGGMDTFVFLRSSDIGMAEGAHDRIADFSQSDGDQIDLSAVAEFSFIGADKFNDDGEAEIRAIKGDQQTFVFGDVNGDGKEDFVIELSGKISLSVDDFVLG